MAYDAAAYRELLAKYLREALARTGQDPGQVEAILAGQGAQGGGDSGGGGGGQQGGGVGGGLGGTALKTGLKELTKYGLDAAFGSDLAATEAANAAWNAGALEAGNAAFNAGAMSAAADAGIAGMIGGGVPAGMTALGAGAYAIPAGTAVPAGFTAVGSAANGGLILASEGALGAGAAGGTAAGGAAAGSSLGTGTAASGAAAGGMSAAAAGGILAALVAAYLTYDSRTKLKKQLNGSDLTDQEILETYPLGNYISKIPGVDLMWKYGPMRQLEKQLWGTTKSEDQVYRDRARKFLQKNGVLGDNYEAQLAQGGTFDFGKDGGAMLKNVGEGERRYSELDPTRTDINMGEATALMNPLGYVSALATGHDDADTATSMAGYFTNAATQDAKSLNDVYANATDWAKKLGITQGNFGEYADTLKERGLVKDEDYDIFKTKLQLLAADEEGKPNTQAERLKAFLASVAAGGQNNAPA